MACFFLRSLKKTELYLLLHLQWALHVAKGQMVAGKRGFQPSESNFYTCVLKKHSCTNVQTPNEDSAFSFIIILKCEWRVRYAKNRSKPELTYIISRFLLLLPCSSEERRRFPFCLLFCAFLSVSQGYTASLKKSRLYVSLVNSVIFTRRR